MQNLALVPDQDHHGDDAEAPRAPRLHHLYYAFLSYSHKDQVVADWLHQELERFRVPRSLAGHLTSNGVVPKQLKPIFRDRHELAASDDLGEEIQEALASSRFLIVLCSPDAAKSRWTNEEIVAFKRGHPDGCVLAAIVAGEPFASDIPGRENEECFPPALTQKYDRRGRATGKKAEPLAADLREEGDGRRMGFLKLVAGLLGVGLDDLVQREATHRHRRMAWLAAASIAGMTVTSTLAVTAIQSRDAARDQRREAESLVAFMVGDLKDKLEPIGKLDALDGVGSRVLAYYSKQDTSELSDPALMQRSRALSLMAEVANLRGDTPAALRFYREAMNGTAEAIRRNPSDPERLFDHAQNVFYFGEMAMLRGDNATAESAMREYKSLAARMIQLGPDNMRWRMEAQYADANLGIVLYQQRRFAEAAAPLAQALQRIQGLAAADPDNSDYQKNVPEALGWLADAKMSQGKLAEAVALREQQIGLLNRLLGKDNVYYRLRLVKANQLLGELYALQGRTALAATSLRTAIEQSDRLISVEPDNTRSLEFASRAHLSLAQVLLESGDRSGSSNEISTGCDIVARLLARDNRTPAWQAGLRNCWLLRAEVALATGAKEEALSDAQRAARVGKLVKTSDPGEDSFWVAKSYRLIGDIQHSLGNAAAAEAGWNSALAAYPKGVAERPPEMEEHILILQRLGRTAETRPLLGSLSAIGYRKLGSS
jgi:tetratricopeptide (TPR) repeat protein